MSQNQIQNFRLFKMLLLQLRAYGLNPADWKIVRESVNGTQSDSGYFFVRHREDNDLRLSGRYVRSKQKLLQVKSLALASL